jgi:hypothetical protein
MGVGFLLDLFGNRSTQKGALALEMSKVAPSALDSSFVSGIKEKLSATVWLLPRCGSVTQGEKEK